MLCQDLQRNGGDVFKFCGDGRADSCQFSQAFFVQISGLNVVVANQTGWTGRIGIQHCREIAHALRGVDEHAPQLATAQDA